jgi:hypothetical protein
MSKIKDYLNNKFHASVVFNATITEFKSQTEQSAEIINQMPLKFLFCFTAGIADAAYYLACCAHQKIGVNGHEHEDLASIMFNVAIMLNVRNKNVAVAIIKDVPQKSFNAEIASNIVIWFREGTNNAYIYQDLLVDILDFDQNLVKIYKISILKNINDSVLKKDFICIPRAKEHLGITPEDILEDLTGERVVSDERLSTLFGGSESDERDVSASYHTFTEGRKSSEIQVEFTGEDSDSFCANCIIS